MLYQTFATQVVTPEDRLPYFVVPDSVVVRLGSSSQPLPVCGEVDGLAYRSILWREDDNEHWYVELTPELAASGRFVNGTPVQATIAEDREPRESPIPYELTETLGMAALAERSWEKLTEAERAPYCEWVGAAIDHKERWRRAERAAVLVRRGEKLEMQGHAS